MGVEYVRDTEIPQIVALYNDIDKTILIEKIYAAQTIGNSLAIYLRQKPDEELSWVKIVQSNPT